MNDDKLKLSDYLMLVSKFESEPDNQEILKQIDDFLSKLIVREYMPLKEKEIAVMFILNNLNKDFDAAGASAFLEIGKVTEGLLSYCINLEKDISAIALGYYLVDSIYKYGLYSTIFNKCEKDCTRLFNMVDNAVNVSNIYRLLSPEQKIQCNYKNIRGLYYQETHNSKGLIKLDTAKLKLTPAQIKAERARIEQEEQAKGSKNTGKKTTMFFSQ